MIVHLSAAAAVLAMLCALLLGVIPALANEPPHSRALHAWLDIWIPAILALPLVALPFLTAASGFEQAATLRLVISLPVSICALIVGLALLDRRSRPGGFVHWHHVAALVAVAALLTLAAVMGRLSDWSGHLLLTAAVLWLWTVSSEPSSAARGVNAHGDPVFLVDWTGPLQQPVGGPAKAGIATGFLVLLVAGVAASIAAMNLHPSTAAGRFFLILAAGAGGVAQLSALAGLWLRVGPAAAVRCSVSTVILVVLLGTGVLCVRLIPWLTLIAGFRHGVEASYEVRDLTGLNALRIPAALALGLALVGLARLCSRRSLAAMGVALAAAGLLSLAVGFVQVRGGWPATDRVGSPEKNSDRAAAEAEPPQQNAGTFLQDGGI